jgi:hypothetical protein
VGLVHLADRELLGEVGGRGQRRVPPAVPEGAATEPIDELLLGRARDGAGLVVDLAFLVVREGLVCSLEGSEAFERAALVRMFLRGEEAVGAADL